MNLNRRKVNMLRTQNQASLTQGTGQEGTPIYLFLDYIDLHIYHNSLIPLDVAIEQGDGLERSTFDL